MKNIGVDLVEIEEIEKIGIDKIANRILSNSEKYLYNQIENKKRKISFLAGRWAAKEAIFKAYKRGHLDNNYCNWSILNDLTFGFPYVLHYSFSTQIMISISHSKNYALAFVILL
ncbi:MAG: 4'-phosphopantetheinyl transferase superfamily protein [Candidatus Phytoplasma stylosanthis]|uniref:holo-ACP synthase n=1 Tax=Candidatus Phytoplasma stylosanthis TaxID=2798314 RepID=UPI0029399EE3|nr:4'-phosphopantetheinyl transferase superfamily protein [Candidatus Phytoplasma stylosanthis]MDV3170814.1 4'-phosphopantetheinyl transferase superfamily protein [Candidatus Phytoplasma stylosanthis]MDV3174172.1 4'-phosphopantetheinyl transferase superfamily protein [Candidatus Phytoplasma stylosanthis]MDV3202537.1 4'-phosphopantetheinyl transferase superfamily protein [Candidatus Phytoplasma stylosanthis]